MTRNIYSLFCILRGKNELVRVPVNTFLAKNYTEAEVYFKAYILDGENASEYALYKIADISRDLKIKPMKIFIQGGFEAKNEYTEFEKKQYLQMKIKDYKKDIEAMEKAETQAEFVKLIFGGTEIKNAV